MVPSEGVLPRRYTCGRIGKSNDLVEILLVHCVSVFVERAFVKKVILKKVDLFLRVSGKKFGPGKKVQKMKFENLLVFC